MSVAPIFRTTATEQTPPPIPSGYPVLDTTFGSPRMPGVAWEAGQFGPRCGVLMQSFDSTSVQLKIELGTGGTRTQRGNASTAVMQQLGEAGVRFMLHPGVYNQNKGTTPATVAQMLSYVKAVGPQYFLCVCNVNEPDNVEKKAVDLTTYWPFIRNYQQELYETFKADPATQDVLIGGPGWSFLFYASMTGMGNIDQWIDCHEVHTYPRSARAPERDDIFRVAEYIFANNLGSPLKPVFVGEMGWNTDSDWGGADPLVKKDQMMPRHYLYHFDHGVALSNNFMHTNPTSGDLWLGGDPASYGWVKSSGLTQPSYETCKRLFALLADPGPRHATTPLAYSVTGNATDVMHVLFQKRDGRYILAIWVGVYADTTRAVNIVLPSSITTARVVRPNFSESWSPQGISGGSISVTLDNYVNLYELS